MAALASAALGNRSLPLRDWALAYFVTWIWPVPVGLTMLVLFFGLSWGLRAIGLNVPFDSGLVAVYILGWVLVFAPVLSWIGLALSVPFVWLCLRFGWGGWVSFVLGGTIAGWMASWAIGGMTVLVPVGLGLVSALIMRLLLGMLRPSVFLVEK